jgi:hypothetical protein
MPSTTGAYPLVTRRSPIIFTHIVKAIRRVNAELGRGGLLRTFEKKDSMTESKSLPMTVTK